MLFVGAEVWKGVYQLEWTSGHTMKLNCHSHPTVSEMT